MATTESVSQMNENTWFTQSMKIDDNTYKLTMKIQALTGLNIQAEEIATKIEYSLLLSPNDIKKLTSDGGFELDPPQFYDLLKSAFEGKKNVKINSSLVNIRDSIVFEIIWSCSILNSNIEKRFTITLRSCEQSSSIRADESLRTLFKKTADHEKTKNILHNLIDKVYDIEKSHDELNLNWKFFSENLDVEEKALDKKLAELDTQLALLKTSDNNQLRDINELRVEFMNIFKNMLILDKIETKVSELDRKNIRNDLFLSKIDKRLDQNVTVLNCKIDDLKTIIKNKADINDLVQLDKTVSDLISRTHKLETERTETKQLCNDKLKTNINVPLNVSVGMDKLPCSCGDDYVCCMCLQVAYNNEIEKKYFEKFEIVNMDKLNTFKKEIFKKLDEEIIDKIEDKTCEVFEDLTRDRDREFRADLDEETKKREKMDKEISIVKQNLKIKDMELIGAHNQIQTMKDDFKLYKEENEKRMKEMNEKFATLEKKLETKVNKAIGRETPIYSNIPAIPAFYFGCQDNPQHQI